MKVKQTVTLKYANLYVGWSALQFSDAGGNDVNVEVTDNQVLEIADIVNAKRDSILEARSEKENEEVE